MIGVVILDRATAPVPRVVHELMREVDEHALRLDAALAFDEIRSIATMEERNKKIGSGLQYAEEMQAKLAATAQETAALVKKAQLEATRIIEDARKSAKEFSDKQQADAVARAADTLAKAQQAIELEHKKMLADARAEIARLVVATTERVLAKKLTDSDRAAYINGTVIPIDGGLLKAV